MTTEGIRSSKVEKKTVGTMIDTSTSYTFEGKHFDVERVFNDDALDTIGTVLLKLIRAEAAAQ